MMAVMYERVALIGLGLIASSMFWAMKRGELAGEVVGYARSSETRETARQIGLCDRIEDTIEDAIKGADLVVLCVPVGAMDSVAAQIAPHLKVGAVVSDVGSVKRAVIDAVGPHLPEGVHFIPAHPLAGTEQSGPESGFAELFDNRWCLLTPNNADAVETKKLHEFWEGLGSKVDEMDADHHDLVLAVTSHTPHLIAYTMVGVADDLERVTDREVINFSATGFRDFTRIAASDPTMWRDVFLNNKDATLEILGRFTEELFALQRAIRQGDGDHLHDYFTRTRSIRRGIIESVSGVVLSTPATINCQTAQALKSWVETGVRPAVGGTGGGVSSLRVVAHYSCRSRNNLSGARLSEHSFGNAIDIAGIGLADGSEMTVLTDWNGQFASQLRDMWEAACGPFGTVLGPEADRFHRDHFHFDTADYRSGSYCR